MSHYDTLSYTYDNLSINKQLYTYDNSKHNTNSY